MFIGAVMFLYGEHIFPERFITHRIMALSSRVWRGEKDQQLLYFLHSQPGTAGIINRQAGTASKSEGVRSRHAAESLSSEHRSRKRAKTWSSSFHSRIIICPVPCSSPGTIHPSLGLKEFRGTSFRGLRSNMSKRKFSFLVF